MSVVIACVDEDSICMAADRIMVRGEEVTYARKIIEFNHCVVGTTGCRDIFSNIIRCPPPIYVPEEYDGDFGQFVNKKMHEWGSGDVLKCMGATAVIAYLPTNSPPELLEMDADNSKNWFSIERLDTSISPYTTIGSGSSYARSAYESLIDVDMSIEERLEKAIRVTCRCHIHARPDPQGNIDVVKRSR